MKSLVPLVLTCKSLPALVDALGVFGFEATYELPHERARFVNADDATVAIGYGGIVSIYGDGEQRESIGAALIESGGAV
jgi:hypothetical protein